MTERERAEILGKIALGLCLAGVVVALVVGCLAVAQPRAWTMRDADNTLLAGELIATGLGLLGRRSGFGLSAVVVGGVLVLGALVALG